MMSDAGITVNVHSGAREISRIVATVLGFGGIAMVAWAIAQGPLAMYATIWVTATLVFLFGQLLRRGVIGMPTRPDVAVGESVSASARAVSGDYLRECSSERLTAIAVVYGFIFLLVRQAIAAVLGLVIGGAAANASIALTAALAFFGSQLWERSVSANTEAITAADETPTTHAEYLVWVARRTGLAVVGYAHRCHVAILALIALGYGVAFLGVRLGVATALGVFQNLWIAGGVGMLLGSLVVAPWLLGAMADALRGAGVLRTAPRQQATAQQPPPAPRPAPAPAPRPAPTPAPAPARPPVSAPVPTAAPARKKVVRKVVKKEEKNV